MDTQRRTSREMTRRVAGGRTVPDRFVVDGAVLPADEIVRRLAPYLSAGRIARIDRVVDERTYAVATVLEGVANGGNVSAVMRTAEGFGFQRFDLVAGEAPFKHSRRTAQGAEKWLDVRGWEEPESCARALRDAGYRILALHLSPRARPVDTIDFTGPVALVFGNEVRGVSSRMLDLVDDVCAIPIGGFVQSFNISVAAALALYHARCERLRRLGRSGDLDPGAKERLRAEFYRRSVRRSDALLAASLRTDPYHP